MYWWRKINPVSNNSKIPFIKPFPFNETFFYLQNGTIGYMCFPGGAMVKNLPVNAGDVRDVCSIPGSGRSSG